MTHARTGEATAVVPDDPAERDPALHGHEWNQHPARGRGDLHTVEESVSQEGYCHGLTSVPQNSYAEALNPGPQNISI